MYNTWLGDSLQYFITELKAGWASKVIFITEKEIGAFSLEIYRTVHSVRTTHGVRSGRFIKETSILRSLGKVNVGMVKSCNTINSNGLD